MAVVDSYSESNQDDFYTLNDDWGRDVGQSFACSADLTLSSVQFYLEKNGSPTGNTYAYIYAHTGTYGTSSLPTGSALAVSDAVDAATVASSFALKEFTFSGGNQISLSNGVKYVVIVRHENGGAANYVKVGADSSSPGHAGNAINSDGSVPPGSYYADNTYDLCFYVNGEIAPVSISVNDSLSLTESLTISVSSPQISVVDTSSLSENISVDIPVSGPILISVNDSISCNENTSEEVKTDFFISINDSVSTAEAVSLFYTNVFVTVNDSISIIESCTVLPVTPIWTDAVNNPKAPVASLEAETTQRLEVDGKFPTPSLTAYSGAIESTIAPVASLEAEITYEEGANLDKKAPTFSLEAYSGAILSKTSPTAELEAESYSNYIKLDSKAPVAVVEATCYYLGSMTLSKTAPFWTIEAEMLNAVFYLDATAPVWYITEVTGYIYEQGEVDKYSPVWKVLFEDMTLFDPGIDADMTAPVGTMREDTGMSDTDKAEGSYSDQYEVTLEYSR